MRGRKPDPAAVKEAKGNPGRRPYFLRRAEEGKGLRRHPELRREALAVWRGLAPELEKLNFLRSSDREPFARYCSLVARYWRLERELIDATLTYESESAHGTLRRIEPKFIVQMHLAKRLEALEDRFGLSPMARQQILLRLAAQVPMLPLAEAKPRPAAPSGPIGLLN